MLYVFFYTELTRTRYKFSENRIIDLISSMLGYIFKIYTSFLDLTFSAARVARAHFSEMIFPPAWTSRAHFSELIFS